MKKTKIIIPAMGMLLLGTAASVTGTVAWFSANNKTTITGMTVTTKVQNNLLIASDTLSSAAKVDDDLFENDLEQTVSGKLEPVSSINGTSFWYTSTSNVKGDGSVKEDDEYVEYAETTTLANLGAAKEKYDAAFNTNYSVPSTPTTSTVVYGYIDYVFQIKAVNSSGANEIRLTKLNLIYNGAKDASKAYRVALFAQDITDSNPTAYDVGTLKKIYSQATAVNFTSGQAVKDADELDTVSAANAVIASIPASPATTKYYKVVVRLWLEGEDKTCNNTTFMDLTSDWALDLEIRMVAADSVVTGETSVPNISKYTSTTVGGAKYFSDGTNAYKAVDGQPDATALTAAACGEIDSGLEAALETAFGITIS